MFRKISTDLFIRDEILTGEYYHITKTIYIESCLRLGLMADFSRGFTKISKRRLNGYIWLTDQPVVLANKQLTDLDNWSVIHLKTRVKGLYYSDNNLPVAYLNEFISLNSHIPNTDFISVNLLSKF